MNLAYKSPSHCEKNTNAYFTPSNNNAIDDENNGGGHTPYLTTPLHPTTILKQHQDFLHAIQSRHSTQPMVLSPLTVNNKQIKTTNLLSSIEHDQLIGLLSSKTLLLDVRSFVQYSHHHIRHSINVSIPNTILKRPTFTLDKIYEAIVLDDAKNKLKQWPMMKNIVFYDDQSQCILENSACAYLGTKLKRAGFKGKLCYLKGVYYLIPKQKTRLILSSITGGFDLFHRFHPEYCNFTAESNRLQINLGAPTRSLIKKTQMNFNVGAFTAPIFENQAFNPFFSNIRQNMELSHGPISERFSIRAPSVYDYTKIPKWLEEATNENGPKRLAEAYEVCDEYIYMCVN